ncbi:TPA: helix-turn-helix transcriptional regulator [Streptococcus agalactiae]|nr:helix-turn-helix transcriptional regulator [Streptococcus agalactiae]HEP1164752.1 helix-turn-helix transcriptional regulator [Streptococcus agalactiae]
MKVFDGAKMRAICKELRLTQYELSPMVGITQNRISDIERNVTTPTITEIDAFSDALKTHVSLFLNNENEIEVVTNTFTKKKKGAEKIDNSSDQMDLFSSEKSLVGSDLEGYVIIHTETYAKLLESQEKLHKLQNLLK